MNSKAKTIEKKQWMAASWDMLYLVQCGIHSTVPAPERVAKMDLKKVYAKSQSQGLSALTYMALESLLASNPQFQVPCENAVLEKWKKVKDTSIGKNLMMDVARAKLFDHLEARGIWHIALKGAVLCDEYPKYGMRQMADNDILFDPSFRQEVHDWFVEQGYQVKSFQKGHHDVYLKEPFYSFEMHIALFSEKTQFVLAQYYRSIKDRLLVVPGKTFEYYMADEDFYLYLLAHAYKHYCNNGIGLRPLLDLYIWNTKKNKMNRSYLEGELKQTGLTAFEHEMRALAQKVFASESIAEDFEDILVEKEREMLEDLTFSGTYGTIQKYWKSQVRKLQPDGNRISAGTKFQYLMRRLFPDRSEMMGWCQRQAPYFLRHPRLMPLARIWRILKGVIGKGKKVKEEVDVIRKS